MFFLRQLGTSMLDLFIIFSGLYSNDITEAHEVVPQKVSHTAEFISHNLTSFHNDGTTHFNISFGDEQYFLVLNNAENIIADHAVIERHKRDVHIRYKPKHKSTKCQFRGMVYGKPNSKVAISACNGLVRYIYNLILLVP